MTVVYNTIDTLSVYGENIKELQSLGLSVDVSNAEGAISFASEADSESPGRLGINLTGFEEEDIFDVGS